MPRPDVYGLQDDGHGAQSQPALSRSPERERGRAVQPEIVKEHSALESLATTLRTWAPMTPASPASGTVPLPPIFGDEEEERSEGRGDASRHSAGERGDVTELPDAGERVAWSRWDELPAEGEEGARRILLIGYKNGGAAIWDCSSLDTWIELLNLPTLDAALDDSLRRKFPRGLGTTTNAAVLPTPLLPANTSDPHRSDRPLVLFSSSTLSSSSSRTSSSTVLLYSLRSHRIISTFSLPGLAHRILTNRRHLVVSTTSPTALHIYSSADLSPHPSSPVTDVARSAFDGGAPVFDLGSGGRLLAYATDRPLQSSKLNPAPALPGAGILAHRGLFEPDAPVDGASGGGSGDFRFAADAAQAGGEVARRVGEGVMSGVKAIGEVGMSYWMTRGSGASSSRQSSEGDDARLGGDGERTFSKSAPQASGFGGGFGRRMSVTAMSKVNGSDGAQNSTAGTVVVVDLVARSASSASSPNSHRRSRTSSSSPSAHTSPLKVVAHFRPYSQPLALVSLSPSSTQLLTSSTAGHSFDVFELKPAVPVGVSATSSSPSATQSSPTSVGKAWHRYRLQRGFTSARASSATWDSSGRFVAVSTGKGTAHVYALNAVGGLPRLDSHFGAKVTNSQELAPLSVNLTAVARVRAPTVRQEGVGSPNLSRSTSDANLPSERGGASTALAVAAPTVVFLPKSDSLNSAFRPPPAPLHTPASSPPGSRFALSPPPPSSSAPSSSQTTFQDLLVFHSSSAASILHRLSLVEVNYPPLATSLATAAEGTLAAASRGDVGKLASSAASGLSMLMKRGQGSPGSGVAAGAGGGQREKREWTVKGETLAGWRLGREKGWPAVREMVGEENAEGEGEERARMEKKGKKGVRYSAFAEIETFSRSSHVLPRSIYQSQQFEFFVLPPDHALSTSKGTFALPLRRLEVRSQVFIRQGDAASSATPGSASPLFGSHRQPSSFSPRLGHSPSSYSSTSASFEPASLDQPIKTAMQTFLDSESFPSPGSPKLPAPTFPNGVPGKHGSWRETVTKTVAPAAMEGFGKVRQGLGKVRVPSVNVPTGMIPLGGRRSSSSTSIPAPAQVAYSSSLSFEDDDAVFAERVATDDAASAGTACTSDGGVGTGALKEDDEDWGWDDRIGEIDPVASTIATPSSGALDTPFEEDFDDLELDLPRASPLSDKVPPPLGHLTLAHPSPLTLDAVDAPSSSSSLTKSSIAIPVPSGLPRHLAPPVSSSIAISSSLSHDDSPSSSLGNGSGFTDFPLGISPSLLDRPGSALSGFGVIAPSGSGLAAATNVRSESPAMSSSPGSGVSTNGSGGSGGGGGKKKKGRK